MTITKVQKTISLQFQCDFILDLTKCYIVVSVSLIVLFRALCFFNYHIKHDDKQVQKLTVFISTLSVQFIFFRLTIFISIKLCFNNDAFYNIMHVHFEDRKNIRFTVKRTSFSLTITCLTVNMNY